MDLCQGFLSPCFYVLETKCIINKDLFKVKSGENVAGTELNDTY